MNQPSPRRAASSILSLMGAAALLALAGCQGGGGGTGPGTGRDAPKAIDQYVEGYQAYKRGNTDLARQNLEAAVINNPDLRMARIVLGEIYRNQNDYQSAARQYEVLSRIDPYTLNNHYYLGLSYQFLTRYRESAVAYLKGLKLDPQDFRSNMNIGTVYLALGETDEAVRYLDKATQLKPDSGAAWSNLGVALDAKNSLVLAETSYRKALELSPDSQGVMQNLANNLLAQKKVGEAKLLWQQIVDKNKTSFSQTKLAETHIAALEFDQANKLLDEVISRDPRYVPALNAKATGMIRQYELSGFTDDKFRVAAVDLLQRSLSLNGGQQRVQDELKKWSKQSGI
jgi:tetratricopeptide (TPR) repeat protein